MFQYFVGIHSQQGLAHLIVPESHGLPRQGLVHQFQSLVAPCSHQYAVRVVN